MTPQGQIKTIQAQEILSDGVLEVVVADEEEEEVDMHLSLNVVSGSDHLKTIKIRALVQDQIMLMLIDTGSSHSLSIQNW